MHAQTKRQRSRDNVHFEAGASTDGHRHIKNFQKEKKIAPVTLTLPPGWGVPVQGGPARPTRRTYISNDRCMLLAAERGKKRYYKNRLTAQWKPIVGSYFNNFTSFHFCEKGASAKKGTTRSALISHWWCPYVEKQPVYLTCTFVVSLSFYLYFYTIVIHYTTDFDVWSKIYVIVRRNLAKQAMH